MSQKERVKKNAKDGFLNRKVREKRGISKFQYYKDCGIGLALINKLSHVYI